MKQIAVQKINVGELVAGILVIGLVVIGGSLMALTVGTIINNAWFIPILGFVLPLIIVGILTVFIAVKLLEILP